MEALPETVKRVVVIRAVPYNKRKTLSCIERALAARRPAGPACAVPRRVALRPDPALGAAAQMRSPRVQAVDLTPFMCSRSRCYPVIGGALVHKDIGHLTRVFAATLGPFCCAR